MSGGEQVIGDDPPMAAPPHGFGAHDRAPLASSERQQSLHPLAKAVGQRVVGVVVKALVAPQAVDLGRDLVTPAAQAAELADELVPDLELRQLAGQRIEV